MAPKLCEITSPTPELISDCSAFIISGRPVTPSVSATGVSASTIFASGATECAYSTSRLVSSAQPTMVELAGSNGGTLPNLTIRRSGSGKPNCWSNTLRSPRIVGEPYESTITIVSPRPSTPWRYSGLRS